MASSIYVVDSSFKRTQVKVTPGKYLREILEEACASRKLNPEAFALKNQNNKTLDLSQPFRLSGLSAGAKLQLTQASRSPAVVSVALQVPEEQGGSRISDKFPSDTSLWLILRKFEEGVVGQAQKKLNLTQQGVPSNNAGAGRLLYRQPCLNMMGRSLESFVDLQKTLAQLGFNSGSVLMRLSYKPSERPLEEAMMEMSQYFDAADSTGSPRDTHSAGDGILESKAKDNRAQERVPVSDAKQAATELLATGVDIVDESEAQQLIEDDNLAASPAIHAQTQDAGQTPTQSDTVDGISVYLAPSSGTPAAALQDEQDSVFEPSVDDAKAHQAALTRASRNTRLLSDKELEEQEAQRQVKLATIHKVDIRVRYPDQSMIETTIFASESAADLCQKVRSTLNHPEEPFELRYVGSKGQQVLPDVSTKRLVADFGFRGKVLVTLAWADTASMKARNEASLKDDFRARARELKVQLASRDLDGDANAQPGHSQPKLGEGKGSGSGGKSKGDIEAKMKKFLAFGKK